MLKNVLFRSFLLIAGLVFLYGSVLAALPGAEEGVFEIFVGGSKVGELSYKVEAVEEETIHVVAHLLQEVATPQGLVSMDYRTQEVVSLKDFSSKSYILEAKTNDLVQKVTAEYSQEKVVYKLYQQDIMLTKTEHPLNEFVYILDNNMYHHLIYLAGALSLEHQESKVLPVTIPSVFGNLPRPVSFQSSFSEKEIEWQGEVRAVVQLRGVYAGVTILGSFDIENENLLQVEIPAQGVLVIRR